MQVRSFTSRLIGLSNNHIIKLPPGSLPQLPLVIVVPHNSKMLAARSSTNQPGPPAVISKDKPKLSGSPFQKEQRILSQNLLSRPALMSHWPELSHILTLPVTSKRPETL